MTDAAAAKEFYSIVTQKGLEKLAETKVTGKNVNLTHMAVGDGNGNYYTLDKSQTELVRELHRCELTLVQVDSKYPNQIIIEAAIAAEIGGFFIREIGIFDEDSDLFAVGKYPVTYKPQSESGSSKDLYIRMVLGFSEAPNIDIYINPHNSVVSSDKFEALQLKLDDYALKDFSNAAEHQKLPGLQGGNSTERYHLTKHEQSTVSSLDVLIAADNKDKSDIKQDNVKFDDYGEITLDHKIVSDVVVKKADESVTYTETTDYTLDAFNGILTKTGESTIPEKEALMVSYKYLDTSKIKSSDVVGGANADGTYRGVNCLLAAQTEVSIQPRILIAPGFTHDQPDDDGETLANPVVSELLGIAERLKAVIIADCPDGSEQDAIKYQKCFGSARVYSVYLKNIGAIIDGKCWADSSINTPDQVEQGKVTFDFDFTPPYPAEHITFRSRMVNDYLEEIFK